MELLSNAKINLGLQLINKREDGFHNIESVFVPIGWNDIISIEKASKFSFSSSGISIPQDNNGNLCERAFRLLESAYGISPVKIHLDKKIPIGAGLGGGSSNAAFVLKGLNELFELGIADTKLERFAGSLGSDCTFFVKNKTAFVSGVGDVIEPIDLKLKSFALLVYPNIHISTAEAYKNISLSAYRRSLKDIILLQGKESWKTSLENDFELSLFEKYEELKKIKEKMYEAGAYYSAMSGSGSTMFALFNEVPGILDCNFPQTICKLA